MKFRETRGTLAESMETMVELPDRASLIEHVQDILDRICPEKQDASRIEITLHRSEPDCRIGWKQTSLVTLEGWGVLGFTDSTV